MNNWIRKMSVVAIIVFGLSLTGCLGSNGSSAKKVTPKVPPVVQPEAPIVTPEKPVNPAQVYNPNGNKSPIVDNFVMPDIDVATVEKGTKVLLEATGTDPEGSTVIIKYSATGGKIITEAGKSYWVAPDKAGVYEVKAVVNDGTLDSDPEIITITVKGNANGLNVAPLKVIQKKKLSSVKKAITSNTSSINSGAGKIILQAGESVDIDVTYSSPNLCAIAPEFANGSLVIKSWNDTSAVSPNYKQIYTYTAPTTVPTGNTTTLIFNIQDQTTFSESATVTVTFVINSAPTISNAVFTVAPTNTIAPLGGASASTKTISVTAADADLGDTLTYVFTKDPNYLPSANATLTTSSASTVDLTASLYTGKGQIGVTVTDSRGGTAQYVFTFYVVDNFYGAIADKTANSTLEFANVVDTDNATVLSSYVTNKTLVSGSQVSRPVIADSDTAYSVDSGLKAYYKNAPTTLASTNTTVANSAYWWSDKVGTKVLSNGNAFTSRVVQAPTYFARYPGLHTISTRINDATGPYVEASSTLYVNEAPDITRVSMVGADGETIALFSNNTQQITPDVSAGTSFAITATVVDADNDRVSPTADATGYFTWLGKIGTTVAPAGANKFLAVVPGSAVGYRFNNIGDDSNFATVTGTMPTAFSIAATSPTMTYTLAANTPQGKRHLVIRAADGMDNVLDGTATTAMITSDATAAPLLPNGSGISYAADDANTGAAPTIIVGYNPEKTNFAGSYTAVCTVAGAAGVGTWKIIDEATGAYIKKADGTDITFLNAAGFLPAPYDWLRVAQTGGTGAVGDKFYFKTNSTQIVVELNVVDGPQITGISFNKYVAAGQSTDIVISAKGRLYQGFNQKSTVTVAGATLGTIATGTDSVVNEVKNKVWTYTAPATFTTGQYEDITLTVKDDVNPSYKTFRTIRIYFNKAPIISTLTAGDTTKVATLDNKNYWIKKATHGVSLSSLASDPDTGDTLGYVWNVTTPNSGLLSFANQASALWEPYNGGSALTATGGNSGKYPVQLMVYDRDSAGVAKGATAIKSIEIGINEDPLVGRNLADSANIDGLVNAEANTGAFDATLGSPWNVGISDPGVIGNGLGNTTVDFNTNSQYPMVKFLGKPTGVNDQPDDRNTLHYSYYFTAGTQTGAMVSTETFGVYVPTAGDSITGVPTKQLLWEPTAAMRKNGGVYWLHLLVTDEKPGVAKGRTEYLEKITITKDTTAPNINADADVGMTVNGAAVIAGTTAKVGDKVNFSIALNNAGNLFRDLNEVEVNMDEFIKGNSLAQTVAPLTDESRTIVSLVKDTASTVSPTDDTFKLEYTIPNGTATSAITIGAAGYVDATTNLTLSSTAGLAQGNMLYVDCNDGSRIYFKIIEGAGVANVVDGTHVLVVPYSETGASLAGADIVPGVATGVPAVGASVYLVKAVDDESANGTVQPKRFIATDISGNREADASAYDVLTGAANLPIALDNDAPVFGNDGLLREPANEDNLRFGALATIRKVDAVVNLPDYDNVFNIGDEVQFEQLVGKTLASPMAAAGGDRDVTTGVIDASNIGLSATLAMAASGAGTNIFTAKTAATTLVETSSARDAVNFGPTATPATTYYIMDDAGNKTIKASQNLINNATAVTDINRIKYITINNDRDAAVHSGFTGAGSIAPATFTMTCPAGALQYLDKGDVIYIQDAAATTATKPFLGYTVNYVINDTSAEVTPLNGAAPVVSANTDKAYIQKAAYTVQGFDLKKPMVSKIEVYSYDSSVTDPTATGYLPVGTRANLTAIDITAAGAGAQAVTVADADYSGNHIGDTVTLTVPVANAGVFYTTGIKKGMTLRVHNGGLTAATLNTMLVMVAADPTSSDNTLSCILLSRIGANINAVALAANANHIMGTDSAAFNVISDAITGIDDANADTAEVIKITFDKPMYVGQDLAVNNVVTDDADGNLGTTLNDRSLNICTTDGVTLTEISTGQAQAVVTGADLATLTTIPNFAYVPSGITASSTSVLYIVAITGRTVGGALTLNDNVNHLAKGTHFEMRFSDITATNDLEGSAIATKPLNIVADFHGNFINPVTNNYTTVNQGFAW